MQTPIICSLAITTMFALVPMAICLCHLKSNPVCCVDQINVRKRLEMNGSGYLSSLHLYQFDLTHLVDVTWPDTQRAHASGMKARVRFKIYFSMYANNNP